MSLDECFFDADEFTGKARLFPLPNLVVFPHVLQPLHIFEPRYRQLFEEALEKDRLVAMAVLAPGWQKDYEGRPPIRSAACLCRIASFHKTEKGTYNALLLGVRRLKIVREMPPSKLFREARCKLVDDVYSIDSTLKRSQLQRRLVESFRLMLPRLPAAHEQLEQLLQAEISLGMLTDIIAYTLNLKQIVKEKLLAQPIADSRALLLLKCLSVSERSETCATFPPKFSVN